MIILSEQQRTEALRACDRIEELCAQQRKAFENILKILDNAAKGRPPAEGLKDEAEGVTGNV